MLMQSGGLSRSSRPRLMSCEMRCWLRIRRCAPAVMAVARSPAVPRQSSAISPGSTPTTIRTGCAPSPASRTPSSAAQERDWSDADLVAAREACHHKIDFSALLPEVDRLLS